MDNEILEILQKDARTTVEQIAVMIGKSADEVKDAIKKLEDEKVILGYSAIVNFEKLGDEEVLALIEVKVTPQRGQGFQKIAERIYRYNQVKSCYLMSGGFDFTVIIEGKKMKEVALFVAEKLAPVDGVLSTATHFVLKKYKDSGIEFEDSYKDDREAVVL